MPRKEILEASKKNKIPKELPKNWLPVLLYKGQYYLYAPSDWGNVGRRMLNDSSFVYWYMDGPFPASLQSIKKIDNKKYSLDLSAMNGEKTNSFRVIIHVIDPETKLSVFEFPDESGISEYKLYVSKEVASRFDVVVNIGSEKHAEFAFKQPDYDSLLKQK